MRRRFRILLQLAAVILLPLFCLVGYGYRDYLQRQRNQALAQEVLTHNTPAAVALLRAGADPNTPVVQELPVTPGVLLRSYWRRLTTGQPDDPFLTDVRSTLLSQAAGGNDADLVEALLEHGARVDATDEKGQTALMYAADRKQARNIAVLLRCHADVNQRNRLSGNTALLLALDIRIMQQLLEAGANVNSANGYGQTALIMAVQDRDAEAVEFLLKHGADVKARFMTRRTALAMALSNHDTKIIRLLKQAHAGL